jgi:predicted hydrolase (HD superfamily)
MRYFAEEYAPDELEYWGMVGLLHDIDFEQWPDEHCSKAPELLRAGGVGEDMIRSIVSHAFGICSDVEPQEKMEEILFAVDELTGLMGAAVLMRPSKSFQDMKVSSVKKKFKDKRFAAGCSRETIAAGAERLGWTLDELLEKTLTAMKEAEAEIESEVAQNI